MHIIPHVIAANAREMKQKSCPACYNLYLAKSELRDRRPLYACVKGHTICANCFTERYQGPDNACPTQACGQQLLPEQIVHKPLMNLIESCASVVEIPSAEMEIERKPIAYHSDSKIYAAKWRRQNVVIKVVKSENEKQKKESSYEANLVVGLLHPNVVRLFGTTRMKSNVGIIMERAEHGSLDAWIGKLDQEKAAKIAVGIVNGLEYVHSRKVVHRDIRPMTILMCGPKDDMIPKIGDFSTSKVMQSVTAATQIGDDFYSAPEIQLCQRYGFTADVFSVTITLFELFNGQTFHDAPTDVKRIIFGVKAGRVDKIPSKCPVPTCLHTVIQRGWSQNPDERPKLSEYRTAVRKLMKKPPVQPRRSLIERNVLRTAQAEEMAIVNIAIPAQAMSWSATCEKLNSKQLRLKMVDDIKTKSTMASMINDSVLAAMRAVPRHLFLEEKKLARSSPQQMIAAAYEFDKPMPTTTNLHESSSEIIGTQLSMTEIILGQSVLLVGIKGGYFQAVIAQLVGINGSVESVTANAISLGICRERINTHCPLSGNVDWIKVPNVEDNGSIVAELKREEKLFHTIIYCFAVDQFPSELRQVLHDDGNVSILAPVKGSGGITFQLFLRRGNNPPELRTITDFQSVSEEAY